MSRIIIPFARGHLEDDTVAAMQAYCPKSVRWSTVCVDEEPNIDDIWPKAHTGYHEMLAAMWGEKETTIIIEHDIVILPGVIESICGTPTCCSSSVRMSEPPPGM